MSKASLETGDMFREFVPLKRRMGDFRAQFRMLREGALKLLSHGSPLQDLNS